MKAAIPSKTLKFREKRDNITGLQICDLVAFPSHVVRAAVYSSCSYARAVHDSACSCACGGKKDDRSGDGIIQGYGMKALP